MARLYLPTFTGIKFDFLDPKPEQISILDISHSLSNLPRYMGHLTRTVSVAEHCVRIVEYLRYTMQPFLDLVPAHVPNTHESTQALCRYALLHDGGEAYYGEWPKPFKASGVIPQVVELEEKVQHIINCKYRCVPGIHFDIDQAKKVKQLDCAVVYAETELAGLMPHDMLPIALTSEEKALGREMFEYTTRRGICGTFGWDSRYARARFSHMVSVVGVDKGF